MTARAHLSGGPQPRATHPTVNAALRHAASTSASIFLVDGDESEVRLPMGELYEGARRVAASLLARGVKRGDRVALVLPTGRDFLEAFFGVQLAGAVPVPLYPPVRLGRRDEYVRSTARMLTAVQAVMVLSDRRVKLLLGSVIDSARPTLGCPTVSDLRDTRDEAEVEVQTADLGVIQFSSGSTVDPKPVALSHASLVAQCASLRALLTGPTGAPEPMGVSWLPLYHDMGLIGCLLSAVTFPGSLALLPPEVFLARPAIWLRTISRHRGTISPAPNFAYGLCLKRVKDDELHGVDLSSWIHALNGAEPVSADVMARFSARFASRGFRTASLMPVYGMSEASLAVTFSPADGEKRVVHVDALTSVYTTGDPKAGRVPCEVPTNPIDDPPSPSLPTGMGAPRLRAVVSVGVPVPGMDVEVRSAEGNVLNEREIGHIWARGASIMAGYFARPEATDEVVRDGWLATGDLGLVDAGELFVCGRSKDVVILRGANHAPQEFEDCLAQVEGVRVGCAVAFGIVPEGSDGEQLVILAETQAKTQTKTQGEARRERQPDMQPRTAEHGVDDETIVRQIMAAIVGQTGIRPHVVELIAPGTLPRTSSGKLRRGEARMRFLARTLHAPAPVNALSMSTWVATSALGFARTRLG